MIGAQVRHDADQRIEAGRIVQLEGRHLERDPVWPVVTPRKIRQGGADISRVNRVLTEAAQNMPDERGGRGLSVRAGDGDDVGVGEISERNLDLAHDFCSRLACSLEGFDSGIDPRTHYNAGGACDSGDVVLTEIDNRSKVTQLPRGIVDARTACRIRYVDPIAVR